MTEHTTILVTGATGKVGRQVVAQLQHTGAHVRALVRDPSVANLPDTVDVVRGDLTVPETLDAALDGVDSVFLLFPTLEADNFAPAIMEAIAKRARRVVYLSAMGVPDDPDQQTDAITASHARLEHLIEQSGLDWTFLRPSGFASNTLRWTPDIQATGVVQDIYGAAARSLIHEGDIAAVAVRALTEDGHSRAKHVLTGPETVTQAEQAHIIGEVTGQSVRFEETAPETARQNLLAADLPEPIVDGILNAHADWLTEPERVTTTVERITGRPARTFREWAIDHADDFRPATGNGRALTTEEVAYEYVSLSRQGRFFDPAMTRLWSPDIVRVAPMETGGLAEKVRGSAAIEENSRRHTDLETIHGVDIDGPYVGQDGRFAVGFAIDTTYEPTGVRMTVTKMSLYTVKGGKITREEVFYFTPPPHAAPAPSGVGSHTVTAPD